MKILFVIKSNDAKMYFLLHPVFIEAQSLVNFRDFNSKAAEIKRICLHCKSCDLFVRLLLMSCDFRFRFSAFLLLSFNTSLTHFHFLLFCSAR